MKKLIVVGIVVVTVVTGGIYQLSSSPQPTQSTPQKSYIALGDSVAAGVGIGTYTDASACNRTDKSYPFVLAQRNNYKLTSFACSGASLQAGILGPQTVNRLAVDPQIDQLFAQADPALITLTIGANDANWTSIFAQCYTGVCGPQTQSAAVAASLTKLTQNLSESLDKIAAHYSKKPAVITTGYYQVFPASLPQKCFDLTGFDAGELAWGRKLQSDISAAIATTVQNYDFVTFQPIDFTGHELCSESPWVQGVSDKQPYHPTVDGQRAIAVQIRKAIQ